MDVYDILDRLNVLRDTYTPSSKEWEINTITMIDEIFFDAIQEGLVCSIDLSLNRPPQQNQAQSVSTTPLPPAEGLPIH